MPLAVVLVSGGLDSCVALGIAQAAGRTCHALSFRYGQRHTAELAAAQRVAQAQGAASHRTVDVDLAALGGSALTGTGEIPKDRDDQQIGTGIPVTYVPARNTVFVSLALAVAEVVGANEIVLGINALDYSGYPDCRPEWLAAMQEVGRLGTKRGVEGDPVKLWAPLLTMSKAEIVRKGMDLGLNLGLTHSCYDPEPDHAACGRCDSCLLRRKGFEEAGVPDPTRYGATSPR